MFLFSCFKAHVLIIYLFDKTTINTNLQMASSTFFAPINSILNFIVCTWLKKCISVSYIDWFFFDQNEKAFVDQILMVSDAKATLC